MLSSTAPSLKCKTKRKSLSLQKVLFSMSNKSIFFVKHLKSSFCRLCLFLLTNTLIPVNILRIHFLNFWLFILFCVSVQPYWGRLCHARRAPSLPGWPLVLPLLFVNVYIHVSEQQPLALRSNWRWWDPQSPFHQVDAGMWCLDFQIPSPCQRSCSVQCFAKLPRTLLASRHWWWDKVILTL